MAFRTAELIRGGLWAWLTFLALMTLAFLVPAAVALFLPTPTADLGARVYGFVGMLYYLMLALMIGGTLSALVTLIATPVAGLVGRALVRVRSRSVHVCAHLALGAAVGAAVAVGIGSPSGSWFSPLTGIAAAATAAAAGTGWCITAVRALRDDARVAALWPERA